MAKKTVTARKRSTLKVVGKIKSSILARIRKEVKKRKRPRGSGGDYYAKDPATKPGGGYHKGDFVKGDTARGSRSKPGQKRKRPSKKKVAKKR